MENVLPKFWAILTSQNNSRGIAVHLERSILNLHLEIKREKTVAYQNIKNGITADSFNVSNLIYKNLIKPNTSKIKAHQTWKEYVLNIIWYTMENMQWHKHMINYDY